MQFVCARMRVSSLFPRSTLVMALTCGEGLRKMLTMSLKSHESCVVHLQSLAMSASVHTCSLPDTMLATPPRSAP